MKHIRKEPAPWTLSEATREYWAVTRGQIQVEDDLPTDQLVCPVCGGIGWVRVNLPVSHPKFGKGIDCPNPNCTYKQERQTEIYADLANKAQIPQAYRGLNFERWNYLASTRPYVMEGKWDAYNTAIDYSQAPGGWLTFGDEARCGLAFTGPNGVGKTSLACSIAHELLRQGTRVLYLRLGDYFDRLRERFDEDGDRSDGMGNTEMEVARTAQRAPMLIIDEFGVEQVTDWKRDQAEKLVNYRRAHDLPTVITTNASSEQIGKVWGMKTAVRLQEMAHWIEMTGPELRNRSTTFRSQ